MKKQLKDYLHLYKDCMVEVKRFFDNEFHIGRVCETSSKSNHGDWVMVWFDDVISVTSMTWETSTANAHHFFFGQDHIKPILRPLSDMTEEEKEYTENVSNENICWAEIEASRTMYLLSRHFDLFGLIEAGLAIDKTKALNGQ